MNIRMADVVPAFSPLTGPTAELLIDFPAPLTHPAGTTVVLQGRKPIEIGLIRSGIVKLIHTGESGEEQLIGLRSSGWWIGGTQSLLSLPSLFSVVTQTECSISFIPASEFAGTLASDNLVFQHFMLAQAREVITLQQHDLIRGTSAEERLRYLLGESSQSIWPTEDLTTFMRQSDIAQLLGITPEHLSRLRSRRASGRQPAPPV